MYVVKARSAFVKTLEDVVSKICREIGSECSKDGEWFVIPATNEEYAKYVAYVLTRAFQRRMLYSYGVPYQVMLIDVRVEKINKHV
jgi:O-acetyl-ADP-ribose deacetylase (regulator of RNase III)